jgi:hypothetical protein
VSEAVRDRLYATELRANETVLWTGRIGFLFWSSATTTIVLFLIAGFTYWATWHSYSLDQFCPPPDASTGCRKFYRLGVASILLMPCAQAFDMFERLALRSGRSDGVVVLTDQRVIRVSTWPWRRVRSFQYRGGKVKWSLGSSVRIGSSTVIVEKLDKAIVLNLMRQTGNVTG